MELLLLLSNFLSYSLFVDFSERLFVFAHLLLLRCLEATFLLLCVILSSVSVALACSCFGP